MTRRTGADRVASGAPQSRRRFLARCAILGTAAPALAGLLAACGGTPVPPSAGSTTSTSASSAPASVTSSAARPSASAGGGKRGSGGTLKLLVWQGPTILNAHLAAGVKDYSSSRIVMEPLISAEASGKLVPVLAEEIPTIDNKGLALDGTSVTYKLRQGVRWADGQPFTADDVVFTFEWVTNKETPATSAAIYQNVQKVEALGPSTVKITFTEPTGAWAIPFMGYNGCILPKHVLKDAVGARARQHPFNLKAFGTGPFKVEFFKPGDLIVYSVNEHYRDPDKPFFKEVQIKGGGDPVSSARAVFQTGDYDWAWLLQMEPAVLAQIQAGGKGDLLVAPTAGVEQIFINFSDPNKEVNGQRSYYKEPHPFLSDRKVRQALALAVDRDAVARQLYGPAGEPTANVVTTPSVFNSPNTKYSFDLAAAESLLEEAGYKRGPDGVRAKNGVRLHVRFDTGVAAVRQKTQEIVKQAWQKIGVDTELKAIDPGVFFSTAPGNPDTYYHFYSDVHMHVTLPGYDPTNAMAQWYARNPAKDIAQKDNGWSGRNYTRYQNPEFDALFDAARKELDSEKARQLWIKLNDLLVNDYATIPLVDRKLVSGKLKSLTGPVQTPFDSETWNIADWARG